MKIQQPWLRPDKKPHTKNLTKTKVNRKTPEISISFSCRIMRTGDGSGGKTISARKMRAFFLFCPRKKRFRNDIDMQTGMLLLLPPVRRKNLFALKLNAKRKASSASVGFGSLSKSERFFFFPSTFFPPFIFILPTLNILGKSGFRLSPCHRYYTQGGLFSPHYSLFLLTEKLWLNRGNARYSSFFCLPWIDGDCLAVVFALALFAGDYTK